MIICYFALIYFNVTLRFILILAVSIQVKSREGGVSDGLCLASVPN